MCAALHQPVDFPLTGPVGACGALLDHGGQELVAVPGQSEGSTERGAQHKLVPGADGLFVCQHDAFEERLAAHVGVDDIADTHLQKVDGPAKDGSGG